MRPYLVPLTAGTVASILYSENYRRSLRLPGGVEGFEPLTSAAHAAAVPAPASAQTMSPTSPAIGRGFSSAGCRTGSAAKIRWVRLRAGGGGDSALARLPTG